MIEEDKRKLLAVEMHALRRSCRISRRQRIKNERFEEMIKLEKNVYDGLQKKMVYSYFGSDM